MTEIKPVQCFTAPADFDGTGVFVGGGWHNVEGGLLRLPRGEYDALKALGFTEVAAPDSATAPASA